MSGVPVRRSSVVGDPVADAARAAASAGNGDADGDGVPDKWGGVGRFASIATDAGAMTVEDLEEWDSDEDMEQLEFDLLDSAEDMEKADADAIFEKSDIPLVGEDSWPAMVKVVEAKLEEETEDITICKLRHQEDRDVEGRGKKTFAANSAEWAELHDEWGSEITMRRRKKLRSTLREDLQTLLTSENPVQRLAGLRGVWEMAVRNTNHVNIDDACLLRLTQALSEPSRELQACAAGSVFNLWESFVELNSTLRRRLPFVVESLVGAAAPRRKVKYNGGELRRMFDQQLQIQFGAGLTPAQKASIAFNQFDKDGGGTIDAEELRELLASLGMVMDDDQLQECLFALDEDGSGDIDEREFTVWFTKTAGDAERDDAARRARLAEEAAAAAEAAAAEAAAVEAKAKAVAKGEGGAGADQGSGDEAKDGEAAGEGEVDTAEETGLEAAAAGTTAAAPERSASSSTDGDEEEDASEDGEGDEPSAAERIKEARMRRRGSFYAAKAAKESQRDATNERLMRREAGEQENEEQRIARLLDEATIESCAGALSCLCADEKARKAMGDRGTIRALLEMVTRTAASICANSTGGGIATELGGGGGALNALSCLLRLVDIRHHQAAKPGGRHSSHHATTVARPIVMGGSAQAGADPVEAVDGSTDAAPPVAEAGERMQGHNMAPGEGFMVGIDRLIEVGGLLKLGSAINSAADACTTKLDRAGGALGGTDGGYPDTQAVFVADAFTLLMRCVTLISMAAKDSVARVALYESSTWRTLLTLLHASSAELVRYRRESAAEKLEKADPRAAAAAREKAEAEAAAQAKKDKKNKVEKEAPPGERYAAMLRGADPAEVQRLVHLVLLSLRGAAFAAMQHCETVEHGGNSKMAGVEHTHALPGFADIDGGISHEHIGTAECSLRSVDIELLLRLGAARNRAATLAAVSIFACLSHTTTEATHQLASFRLKPKAVAVEAGTEGAAWRDEEKVAHQGEHAVLLLLLRAARGQAWGANAGKTTSGQPGPDARMLQLFGIAGLAGVCSEPGARRFVVHVAVPMPMPGTHTASGKGPLLAQLLEVCDHMRCEDGMPGAANLEAGLRRHAAGALMLLSLGCGDHAADEAELELSHLGSLAAYTNPNDRWRWPRHHLALVVSLLKHQDATLVGPAALTIFCLGREATGANSRTFVELGAVQLLVGWVASLMLTAPKTGDPAAAPTECTAPTPAAPAVSADDIGVEAADGDITAGAAAEAAAAGNPPAYRQLLLLTHMERAMLLEYAVGAIWLLLHGGSVGGDTANESAQIDGGERPAERRAMERAAAALVECGGVHVLTDLVRVLPALGAAADTSDASHAEDEIGGGAILARVQQHAVVALWVANRAHAPVAGEVARAGLLPLLLSLGCEIPHDTSGADVLVVAATRYLSCQFLQELVKLAVERAAADAAAADDTASESEGEEASREAAEADTATLYAAAASTSVKRGEGSMEYAMLLLLRTVQVVAGQAYGAAVLCKLSVSAARKRSIALLGGVGVAMDEVRRTWHFLTNTPPPSGSPHNRTRREVWEIRYEVFERSVHLLLNLSTDVGNQALIANTGLDLLLTVARDGDVWLEEVRQHGVFQMSEQRPRSRAATSGGPDAPGAPTETLGGHGNAGATGFTPVQCAKWILENIARHPDARTRFYTQELLLKVDDCWAELMGVYGPKGQRFDGSASVSSWADGCADGSSAVGGGSDSAHTANSLGAARLAVTGGKRVADHMEVGSVETELAAAERTLESLLRRQRDALRAMLRPASVDSAGRHPGSDNQGGLPLPPPKTLQERDDQLAQGGAAPELRAPISAARTRVVGLRRLLRALLTAAEGGAGTEEARAEAAAAAAALAFSATATTLLADRNGGGGGSTEDDGVPADDEMRWPGPAVLSASFGVVCADAAADRLGAEQALGHLTGSAADAARRTLSSPRTGYQQWWRGALKEESDLARRFAKPPVRTREQMAEANLASGKRRDLFAQTRGPSSDDIGIRLRLGGAPSAVGAEALVADASTTGALPQLPLNKKMGALLSTMWDRDAEENLATLNPAFDDDADDQLGLLPHMRSKVRQARLHHFKDRWAPSETDLFLAQYHLMAEAPLMLPEQKRTVRVAHWPHIDRAGTCSHDLELPAYARRSNKERDAQRQGAAPGAVPKKARRRKKGGNKEEADSQAFEDSQKAIKALAAEAEKAHHVETVEERIARKRRAAARSRGKRVHMYVHDKVHERVDDFATERIPLPPWRAPTLRRPYGGLFCRRPRVSLPPPPKRSDPPVMVIPRPPAPIIPNAKTLPGPTWGVLPDENMYFVVITLEGVMPPLISPNSGVVPLGQLVTIECDTDGAEIFYTLDGSEPEPWSEHTAIKLYTEPFPLTTLGIVPVRAIAADRKRKKPSPIADEEFDVQEEAKVKKVWTLLDSIWVPRLKESESKDFYDSSKLHRKTFEQDWDRCFRKKHFRKYLERVIQGDEEAFLQEVSEIKQEVWEDYDIITHAFDFYAACSTGDGFSIKLNAYSDFLDDCFIPEESEACNQMVLDTIFTSVNLEDDDNLTKAENAGNADREFVRCEFCEMIVRVGFAKYLNTGETDDPSEAIDDLCVGNCRSPVLLGAFCVRSLTSLPRPAHAPRPTDAKRTCWPISSPPQRRCETTSGVSASTRRRWIMCTASTTTRCCSGACSTKLAVTSPKANA